MPATVTEYAFGAPFAVVLTVRVETAPVPPESGTKTTPISKLAA